MQTARRSHGLPPLAIVLPHPTLPRRRSSLLSSVSGISSPHTPRSRGSPSCSAIFFTDPRRNSTDSWNSSNPPDDLDVEWKQEDILLLTRTLDALPAHLVTPFNGPIPPNNLLDKIARGVSQAKGPVAWPYSIRATRVKLMELARLHAQEDNAPRVLQIAEEEPIQPMDTDDTPDSNLANSNYSYHGSETPRTPQNSRTRKPLYRQSSMDFMTGAELSTKPKDNLASRLERADRQSTNPTFHPYSRLRSNLSNGSSTPPPPPIALGSMNEPTPSSALGSATPGPKRRSALSSNAVSSLDSAPVLSTTVLPPVREIPPPVPPKDKPRRPLHIRGPPKQKSMMPTESKSPALLGAFGSGSPADLQPNYASSDEEEKRRAKSAKRLRSKNGLAISVNVERDTKGSLAASKESHLLSENRAPETPKTTKTSRKYANLTTEGQNLPSGASTKRKAGALKPQRNPSTFDGELPSLSTSTPMSRSRRLPLPETPQSQVAYPPPTPSTVALSPPASSSPAVMDTVMRATMTPSSPPGTQKVRTLRRVRRILAPARRISFGNPEKSNEGLEREAGIHGGLESAFQLA